MSEQLSTRRRLMRVLRNPYIWLFTLILFAGLFIAIQAKRDLDLAHVPRSNSGASVVFDLPLARYNGPILLTVEVSNLVSTTESEIYTGLHHHTTAVFSGDEARKRQFWLERSSTNVHSLIFQGLPAQADIDGKLTFPKVGKLMHVHPLYLGSAWLTLLAFAWVLSMLFRTEKVFAGAFATAVVLLIAAVHIVGLDLLVRAPAAAVLALVPVIMIAGARLVFPDPS